MAFSLLYLGPGGVLSSDLLLFFGLDPIGFDSRDEISEETRPVPDTSVPIKDHLPSFFPPQWQGEKRSTKFAVDSPQEEKNAPGLLLCLEGDFAASFTHTKATKMNKLWR